MILLSLAIIGSALTLSSTALIGRQATSRWPIACSAAISVGTVAGLAIAAQGLGAPTLPLLALTIGHIVCAGVLVESLAAQPLAAQEHI